VVIVAKPPADAKRRAGLYWIYFGLLAIGSVFWLAVVSPIIRPTLPSHPAHLLFCIFAGITIADAAAHAIADIAAIWKPHDLGGAQEVRRKFSVRKLLAADVKGLASHLSVIPFVGLMAYGYTLLPPHIEDRLFGSVAGEGAVYWNFISQSIMGGTDVFGFFLSQDTKATMQQNLHRFAAAQDERYRSSGQLALMVSRPEGPSVEPRARSHHRPPKARKGRPSPASPSRSRYQTLTRTSCPQPWLLRRARRRGCRGGRSCPHGRRIRTDAASRAGGIRTPRPTPHPTSTDLRR